MLPPTDSTAYLKTLDALSTEVRGAADAFAAIRHLVAHQPPLLDNPKQLQGAYATAFHGVAFDWPWLNMWKLKFAELGAVPRMWTVNGFDPVFLLHHVAMHRSQRGDFKFGYVRFGPPLSDEPVEIQAVIASEIERYATASAGFALPPFFPGDRTIASSALPPKRPAKAGVTICPFRGVGEHC